VTDVARLAAIAALAFAIASCGGVSIPTAPPTLAAATPFSSIDAALGVLHVETEPAVLAAPLSLRYLGTATQLAGGPDEVAAGVIVSLDRVLSPDLVQVVADGQACEGTAEILAGVESDMVLEWRTTGACSIALKYTHAVGAIHHPIHGAVFGAVVAQGATVKLQPLDAASSAAPIAVTAGPTGVEPMEVPLGRYRVSATLDGEVLKATEIEFGPGGDIVVDLMALSRRVPRDCGGVDAATCDAAIQAALHYGQWVGPARIVASVQIRKTTVQSCDPGIKPALDVVFQVAPSGEINVTVGHTSSGAWQACPPY
jgi:hypothetical protein